MLIHGRYVYSRVSDGVIQETFPTTASQNAIVFRYTTPVKMVALEIKTPRDFIACTLVFRFSDATVIRLGIELFGDIDDEGGFYTPWEDMAPTVFSQAHGTVLGHPLLPNVKRLHILNEVFFYLGYETVQIRRKFGSVDPLRLRSTSIPRSLPWPPRLGIHGTVDRIPPYQGADDITPIGGRGMDDCYPCS